MTPGAGGPNSGEQNAGSAVIAQYDGPTDSGSEAGPGSMGPWFHPPVDHDRN